MRATLAARVRIEISEKPVNTVGIHVILVITMAALQSNQQLSLGLYLLSSFKYSSSIGYRKNFLNYGNW